MDYRTDAPKILRDFLIYHETIKGHSKKTVDEYFLDLRTFFRYLKLSRKIVSSDVDFDEIDISDIDLNFIEKVTLSEVYEYLGFLSRDRVKNYKSKNAAYGLSPSSRARKIASIKSFFKYLTVKTNLLKENPVQDLDSPKIPKTLPKYLTLDESERLLSSISGKNKARDYCIICIFLNCGLRISEIIDLNLTDIRNDSLRVIGKGNKERVVFLNDSTAQSINNYLLERKTINAIDKNALFLSNRKTRMTRETVHSMVKKSLLKAGLDATKYSAHKLRHTAATLMLQNGVDVRTLQELLGHENLNTTQIYTHVDNSDLRLAASANPLGKYSPDEMKKPK